MRPGSADHIFLFLQPKHEGVDLLTVLPENTVFDLTLAKDAEKGAAATTSGFSHFSTPMSNQRRQAVSDGVKAGVWVPQVDNDSSIISVAAQDQHSPRVAMTL